MPETLDPIELHRFCTQWGVKQEKGRKGENAVYDSLIDVGYDVVKFEMLEEGDDIPLSRKKQKLKEARFPDGLAHYRGDGEAPFEPVFFLDVKYKRSRSYLGIVNKIDYDGYFAFLRYGTVATTLKLFFYIDDERELWRHTLRNPRADPDLDATLEEMRGTDVYRIFRSELEFWKRVYN